MALSPRNHIRAVLFALTGFALWVLADTSMKLVLEADLPSYEVVGFLGFFAVLSLLAVYAPRGRVAELWPKRPGIQIVRALMAFGCVMANTFALRHLPLTVFYVVVFISPMIVAILASVFLNEKLSASKIAAIIAGFAGVVVAIDPWRHLGAGDWIGYAAAIAASFFYAAATVILRAKAQRETPHSMIFVTALVETVLGFGAMAWHAAPFAAVVLLILAAMGIMNVAGNLFNALALRDMAAATVEQYHYTQILTGASLGYLIWHDVPTLHTLVGAAIIIGSGLYVAAATHKAATTAAAPAPEQA